MVDDKDDTGRAVSSKRRKLFRLLRRESHLRSLCPSCHGLPGIGFELRLNRGEKGCCHCTFMPEKLIGKV
jgi:hypothetical protein